MMVDDTKAEYTSKIIILKNDLYTIPRKDRWQLIDMTAAVVISESGYIISMKKD
ncbi:MAG TPA: hypothetical protein VN703_03915 [Candidatus Sulfopaludibacter sp.]|jgi:hypothetical protein|nr:hypothetical protein [Candidatus Sulfopaludibacter sp.]